MMFGIALAALMIGLFAWTRTGISRIGERPDKRFDDPRRGTSEGLERLDGRLRAVEHGQTTLSISTGGRPRWTGLA